MTTNLIELIRIKDIEGVKKFIADGGDINLQDKDGETGLMCAVYWLRVEIAKLLVEAGARQDLRGDMNNTALESACLKEYLIKFDLSYKETNNILAESKKNELLNRLASIQTIIELLTPEKTTNGK